MTEFLSNPITPADMFLQWFFPDGAVWTSVNDLIYKGLTDRYFIRLWDFCGLALALIPAMSFYLFYWFNVEALQT
jgi:hypothetical protein